MVDFGASRAENDRIWARDPFQLARTFRLMGRSPYPIRIVQTAILGRQSLLYEILSLLHPRLPYPGTHKIENVVFGCNLKSWQASISISEQYNIDSNPTLALDINLSHIFIITRRTKKCA